MSIITSFGSDGLQYEFKYTFKNDRDSYNKIETIFHIVPVDVVWDDWFEFTITQINETTGKVTMMSNNGIKEYSGKGIPEAMIKEASRVLGLHIISSTNAQKYKLLDNERREVAATKVWERLLKSGEVTHDPLSDIYTFKNVDKDY